MRVLMVFACIGLTVAGFCVGSDRATVAPGLRYLGETPPGRTTQVFAAGRISDAGYRLHGSPVFSPDHRAVYWSVIPPVILSVSLEDGRWGAAAPVPLPGRGIQAPALSADGNRLYFQGVLEGGRGSADIWWTDRTDDGWGSPVPAGSTVNTDKLESQPTVSADGTLYFTGTQAGVGFNRGIFRSRWIDGAYTTPELLGEGINSPSIDYCPWIATDESYLLFASSRPRTEEVLYLHVTFRRADGSWTTPVNIHPAMNFSQPARSPSVSPDGRYLFFLSGGRVYWVDMAVVLELRPSAASAAPAAPGS